MRSSADSRVRARRQKHRRARRFILFLAALAVLSMPFAVYFIDFPYNLIVAIPLGVGALWLFMWRAAS